VTCKTDIWHADLILERQGNYITRSFSGYISSRLTK